MAAPNKINWKRIEPDWRAGIKSVRQIVAEYKENLGISISHTAIIKHFKGVGIKRDLLPKVKEKAETIVSTSMVSSKGLVSEEEIVDTNAEILATIQLAHRKDVRRTRSYVVKLLHEVELLTNNHDLFEKLPDLVIDTNEDDSKAMQDRQYKRRQAFNKVLGISSRIDSVKKLAESLRILIELERKVYGIDSGSVAEDTLESCLAQIRVSEKMIAKNVASTDAYSGINTN